MLSLHAPIKIMFSNSRLIEPVSSLDVSYTYQQLLQYLMHVQNENNRQFVSSVSKNMNDNNCIALQNTIISIMLYLPDKRNISTKSY